MADLIAALEQLRREAGTPTLRAIEEKSGISRSALSKTFRGQTTPTWENLTRLVAAMNGSPEAFAAPWEEALLERIRENSSAPREPGALPALPLPPMLTELREIRELLERLLAQHSC